MFAEVEEMKKYRIVSKTRFTICILIVSLMLTALVVSVTGIGTSRADAAAKPQHITVESGDTIWDIASEYKPENTDIRKAVDEICQANDIQADELQAGQDLVIPVM
jgi:LysM repeat protein